jgi:hypothetical protein
MRKYRVTVPTGKVFEISGLGYEIDGDGRLSIVEFIKDGEETVEDIVATFESWSYIMASDLFQEIT